MLAQTTNSNAGGQMDQQMAQQSNPPARHVDTTPAPDTPSDQDAGRGVTQTMTPNSNAGGQMDQQMASGSADSSKTK